MRNKKVYQKFIIVLVLLLAGLFFYSTRFLMSGIPYYNPEDTYFHLIRLKGLENVWISPVNFNTFTGNGTYINVFYPWLTMYPMWIIYHITGSYVWAYNIYMTILTIVTIYIAYFVMRKMTDNELSSVCFAVLYTYSSYRFVDIFKRGALGESIVITFLPLVLLGLYEIVLNDYKKWKILSIGIALIAYTHLLSLFHMAMFSSLIFVIILLIKTQDKNKRIIAFVKGIISSIILSLGVLIPIFISVIHNDIQGPAGNINTLVYSSETISKILINSLVNKPTAQSVGLLVLVIALANVFFVIKEKDKTRKYTGLFFIVFGLVLLFASSTLFPWQLLGRLPFVKDIQFVWRLNVYTTLFETVAFGLLSPILFRKKNSVLLAVGICLLAAIINIISVFMLHKEEYSRIKDYDIDNIIYENYDYDTAIFSKYHNSIEHVVSDYYLNDQIISASIQKTDDGTSIIVRVDNVSPGDIIDIPVIWYSSIRADVNGVSVVPEVSDRGTTAVKLDCFGAAEIKIYHNYNIFVYISWGVSLGMLLVVIFDNKIFPKKREELPN